MHIVPTAITCSLSVCTSRELLDSSDLPDHAKKKVLVIIVGAETALNAQNKETPYTVENEL